MIILGIDPGTATTGFGIVENKDSQLSAIDYGCIQTEAKTPFGRRLNQIYDRLTEIISRYNPGAIAMEGLFFCRNVKTALSVGQAQGVIILAAIRAGQSVYEYTPLQIKQAVTGFGRADKNQVQEMVRILLNLPHLPKPDDAADALAVAICHIHSLQFENRMQIKTD
ncbi:MAG: crossover junction endodeoxyribonuclease RuvC [bacterium]|nr:crossover junction endodeoxyribonuclease RuvC [bacterium]